MKLPKFKLNVNIKPLLNYIVIILVSALFIASIFIALPLTEKFLSKVTYNLNVKDSTYWSEEYTITLENTDTKTINDTKNIFYKRLKGFGTEEVSTYVNGSQIIVDVTSSKDKDLTTELISNRFDVSIMTRKSDVNFDSSDNTYAYILASNYDSTEWTRNDFRDIYITNLKTSSGTYSNFAVFKLWPNNVEKFNSFLAKYNGQYIGVAIDGYVTPHLVDSTSKVFAIPISTTNTQQLKVMSLLYNSGVISTNYNLDSKTTLTPNVPKVDYIQLTIGIFVAIIVLYSYLFISKPTSRDILIKAMLATTLTISIYLSFLKISQLPVDTFVLAIEAVLVIVLTRVLAENKDSMICIELMLLLVCTTLIFLGSGYISIIALDMLLLTVLAKLCLLLSGWYINKVKKL